MSRSSVLIVEDESALREALCDTLGLAGIPATAARNGREALDVLAREDIAMVVSDVQMKPMDGHALLERIRQQRPDVPVLLMTAYGTIQKAVEAIQNGAVDYLVKPFDAQVLVEMVSRYMKQEAAREDMVAADERTRRVAALAMRVAATDATVMITGESGTGKEVIARFIHQHSPRAEQPFVAINCAAIPDNMLEATLFGYEKGAFTGAYQACPGKFEQAQGGTILLDEISEMDLGLQAKLLRVLQEREVERLGGRKTIELDVRVLATSNRDMRAEVRAGRFREDLFYRLNVFPLHLPPLRQRPADILPLAERFLVLGAARLGRAAPRLSAAARERLLAHAWPGNVRELDNVLQRALILQTGEEIGAEDLQFESGSVSGASGAAVDAAGLARASGDDTSERHATGEGALEGSVPEDGVQAVDLKSQEQRIILETLRAVNGSRKAAAERLGISQRTLRYKLARMREMGIAVPAA